MTPPPRPGHRLRSDARPHLAALLSHPEIVVTVIEYASAASIYAAIETTTPSRETQANGHPRQYDPIFQSNQSRPESAVRPRPRTPCRGPWPSMRSTHASPQ